MPVRDAVATLAEALASVRAQTRRDWECLVVDDGSTDLSPAIAREHAKRDPRFVAIERPPAGIVAALDAGLDRACGAFVARMDADDRMHPERLEAQLALLAARADLAGVGSHVRSFPRAGRGPGERAYEHWLASIRDERDVRRDAFVECPLAHPTWTVRREAFETARYRDVDWPEDHDLLLRWLGAGLELGTVPRPLLAWRRNAARLSRTSPRYSVEAFARCRAHHLVRGLLAGSERYGLWGYGATGRGLARALAAEGRRPAGIVEVHPGRLGNRIGDADVIAPEDLDRRERLPLVVSVAGAVPRARIRRFLAARGFRDGTDFVCAA